MYIETSSVVNNILGDSSTSSTNVPEVGRVPTLALGLAPNIFIGSSGSILGDTPEQQVTVTPVNTSENTYKTDEINKITLELFMNKNNYKKYLSKTDPKKYEEHLKYLSNVNKYKHSITRITHDLLDNPDMQITTDVNEIFEMYVKTLIAHLQQKEYECADDDNSNNNNEDTLFGEIADDEPTPRYSNSMHSFWGKERVVKKPQNQMEYDLNLFGRGRKK